MSGGDKLRNASSRPRALRAWGRPASIQTRESTPSAEPRPIEAEVAPVATQHGRRLLLVNQYYWPDTVSTAQHLTDLAEHLAAQGYEVHVLCSRGGSRAENTTRLAAREFHNGVVIHRVGATSLGRRSTWTRMADYLSFAAGAVSKAVRLPRFDVVVTLTTPPLVGLLGTALQKLRGSWHVWWSMDLHPDASIALGRMKSSHPATRFFLNLASRGVRKADRVVALGPYMADRLLAKRVRPEHLATIPVWSRADEVEVRPLAGHPLRARLGLANRFVAMYSGNLGLAHGFDDFLDAANTLRDRPEFTFLFVGGGPRRAEVEARVRELALPNVQMLDPFSRSDLPSLLSLPDVHLISMRPEMTGIVVPSKVYGAMASGRPVVFVGPEHCEAADLIREASCGVTIRQGESVHLVEALERLRNDPEAAEELGRAGREAFLVYHERDVCCEQWSRLIAELTARRTGAPSRLESVLASSTRPGPVRCRVPSRSLVSTAGRPTSTAAQPR